jgi:predicted transcriptional regulator
MSTLKAVVRGGRAIIEDVGDYPDGTVLELSVVDEHDEMSDEERARLDAALERSLAEAEAGKTRPMEDVIAELRARGR